MPVQTLIKTLPLLLLTLPTTNAWGSLGHATVAYIAENYIADETKTWAQQLLANSTDSGYMAAVASWADSYRYTKAGAFSAPYHFIDSQDNPPETCGVDYDRDCGAGGCVVSAIANYTSRVQDSSLSATEQGNALRFLIHFFGDVTQPLHDEALDVGGNEIDITFDGTKTNLHHIWDTNIPEKYVGGYSQADAMKWASELIDEIQDGDYADQKGGWVSYLTLDDVQTSGMDMATDGNSFVCSDVLVGGVSAVEGTDLGGQYYQDAVPIVNGQIAKGGYRLAAWLNLIVTGNMGL